MSEIYFVRHGQSTFKRGNFDRLSDLGKEQLKILGDYFVRTGRGFDAIYSGSMRRQLVSAKAIMARLQDQGDDPRPLVLPEFSELDITNIIKTFTPMLVGDDPSVIEETVNMYNDRRILQGLFERTMLKWLVDTDDHFYIKEDYRRFTKRIRAGVDRLMEECGEGKSILVLSSCMPIAAVAQMALNLPDEDAVRLSFKILNSSVSVFELTGGRLSMSSFNSVAHLELEGNPELITVR